MAENALIGLTTLGVICACVIFHYEGLSLLGRWMTLQLFPHRIRIVVVIFGQVLLHLVEIWIFAVTYYLFARNPDFGGFSNPSGELLEPSLLEQFYYSSIVYSTLGFGDIVPVGAIRVMSGTEAVLGLILITWSASFTFLEMQRHWNRG